MDRVNYFTLHLLDQEKCFRQTSSFPLRSNIANERIQCFVFRQLLKINPQVNFNSFSALLILKSRAVFKCHFGYNLIMFLWTRVTRVFYFQTDSFCCPIVKTYKFPKRTGNELHNFVSCGHITASPFSKKAVPRVAIGDVLLRQESTLSRQGFCSDLHKTQ